MSRRSSEAEGVTMLGGLYRWLSQHRRRRAAVAAAALHFESVTGHQPHPGWGGVIGEEAGEFVVRVCYGDTKPPRRVWYRVGADGQVRGELSCEEAQRFGEREWR